MPKMILEDKVIIHDTPYGLDDIERLSWRLIYHGTLSSRNPMHYLFVASQGKEAISLRTVVLRSADPTHRTLRFHTDKRSGKYEEFLRHPQVSLLLYDNPEKTQLRMTGIASIHTGDDLAKAAWEKTGLASRKCYLATEGPSSPSAMPSSGLPAHLEDGMPGQAESEAGRVHFCVVQVRITTLDWLNLSAHGHRRAHFVYDETGKIMDQHWLIP